MVLGGKVNKDLVTLIEKLGGKAIGITGMDSAFIKAKKLEGPQDLGYVGEITSVDDTLLNNLIESKHIPVISSIAISEDLEHSYNINADLCASKIASSLKAEKLILLTDVPGVLMDPKDKDSLISSLRPHEIRKLKTDGILKKGMIPKIECCVEAVRQGSKENSYYRWYTSPLHSSRNTFNRGE